MTILMSQDPKQVVYVSAGGNDGNDGFSAEKPVRTLKRAEELIGDGTWLMFKGREKFAGSLDIRGVHHLFIGSYGIGAAQISPQKGAAIRITDCTDVAVAKLRLAGRGFRSRDHSGGIELERNTRASVRNVEACGFPISGISVKGCADTEITGCFLHDNGAVGLHTGSSKGRYCENIRISHCRAYDNAGDPENRNNHSGSGIIIAETNHAAVEFCDAAGNGWAQRQIQVNGPVGIWCCCGCDDVTFRYNISRYNRTQPGGVDGDGLDIDGEVRNAVMEYNYTYGNEGSGYLLCEFWGSCTDTLWHNNITRYCVSCDDATRVPGYGAVNMSAPKNIPFDSMHICNNLLIAGSGLSCVYNKGIPATVGDLTITDNLLITDGTPAIADPQNPYMHIADNLCIENRSFREKLAQSAPKLCHPRDLLRQPVYEWLKSGRHAAESEEIPAAALFVADDAAPRAEGFRLMELQLYGPDFEGTDKKGTVVLTYDSLRPGVVTRLCGKNAEISAPLPWWEREKRYVLRATARLQSPDVIAYLFIRDENGKETRTYFNATTAEYTFAELLFAAGDKWSDPGKYAGVRVEDGIGGLYVHSLEFIELAQGDGYAPAVQTADLSEGVRSFGDCWQHGRAFYLYHGAQIEKTVQVSGDSIEFSVDCTLNDSAGYAYIRHGQDERLAELHDGLITVSTPLSQNPDIVTVGVSQDCTSYQSPIRIVTAKG